MTLGELGELGGQRRPPGSQWRSEQGSATILTIALASIILGAGVVGLTLVQAHLASAHAQTAADLAALAGASASSDPCRRAEAIAAANGVTLTDCQIDGLDLVVAVAARAPSLVQRIASLAGQPPAEVTALSRAGY